MKLFDMKSEKTKRAATKKFPSGFTIMVIPDSADEAKTIELSYDRLVKMFAGAVAVSIILVGLIISMMVHNYSLKSSLAETETTVAELKDINVRLGKTVASLDEQVKEDKEAFDKIESTIDRQEKEITEAAIEAAIPSGVAVKSASAVIVVDPNKDNGNAASNGVVFSTTTGAVIVATGAGVIETVSNDDYYMKKIVINHNNGYKSVYRIPNDVTCIEGMEVKRNDMLAVLTADGYFAYEVIQDGVYIDPRSIMVKE